MKNEEEILPLLCFPVRRLPASRMSSGFDVERIIPPTVARAVAALKKRTEYRAAFFFAPSSLNGSLVGCGLTGACLFAAPA
jgi:hypothetical protein